MNNIALDLLILIPLLIAAGAVGFFMARSDKFFTPYDQKSMNSRGIGSIKENERKKRVQQSVAVLTNDRTLTKIAEEDRAAGKKEDPLKNPKIESAFRASTQLSDLSLDEIEGEDRQRVLAAYMFAYVAAEKRASENESKPEEI